MSSNAWINAAFWPWIATTTRSRDVTWEVWEPGGVPLTVLAETVESAARRYVRQQFTTVDAIPEYVRVLRNSKVYTVVLSTRRKIVAEVVE